MHRHADGVAHIIIRYRGNVDGAIVSLGIGYRVLPLVVVNGETVVCTRSSVFPCLADRIYGITPVVDAPLCLGGKLHVDVLAFPPHTLYAHRVMAEDVSAVRQHLSAGEAIDASL